MRQEIIFPTHNLSKYEKNWGFLSILKSYNELCISMFCPCIMDKDRAGPRVLSTLMDADCVITSQKKVNKVSKCLENVPNMLTFLCCKMTLRAKTRAQNFEMLKMT